VHLRVGNLDIFLVASVKKLGSNGEASLGCGCADTVERGLVAVEGASRPILADLAEQAMLDRVPLGRAGRIVTDGYRQIVDVAQLLLQAVLPDPAAVAVAATAVA